jgi:hypothetical protein
MITKNVWTLEKDGSLVMDGQVVITPEMAKPDYAPISEGKKNLRCMVQAQEMVDILRAVERLWQRGGMDTSDQSYAIYCRMLNVFERL